MSGKPAYDLSPDDQLLLDRLVDSGFEQGRLGSLTPQQQQRVEVLANLFGLLEDYPVEDGDDSLIHATIARIDRYEEDRQAKLTISAGAPGDAAESRGRRIRLPDFISVAAVLLIAAGIGWPVLSKVRDLSMESSCANNMQMVAQGFSAYAVDYHNVMPVSQFASLGGSWDKARNIDNLAPLVNGGYCEEGQLKCPGHSHDGPSFSYQMQTPNNVSFWGLGRARIVLGDRNPLIDAALIGRTADSLSVSLNHAGGQNVLEQDGSVAWLEVPKVGQDNIWLPVGVMTLHRGDRLMDPKDVFLAH